MSILSGFEIRRLVEWGHGKRYGPIPEGCRHIDIVPFDPENCGPNSYDVTLSKELLVYDTGFREYTLPDQSLARFPEPLDMKVINRTRPITIPATGHVLEPGRLYLGSTVERTVCRELVPWFDGRSSVGRLGLFVHVTAGRGDDGFDGTWTLEMTAVQPIRIYAGVRIGQISFMTLEGESSSYRGKYSRQSGPRPSELWRDFLPEGSK